MEFNLGVIDSFLHALLWLFTYRFQELQNKKKMAKAILPKLKRKSGNRTDANISA